MKTFHAIFVGGPDCGAMRVMVELEPVVRVPIALPTVFVSGDEAPPAVPKIRFHHYMPTGERDSQKRIIYEYRGEA